jgi:predicted transcriptional regulator
MAPLDDWNILKSAIEKKAIVKEKAEDVSGQDFSFNKTDVAVIRSLLADGRSLAELREAAGRSRVSVYLSVKKLRGMSVLEEDAGQVRLKEGPLSSSLRTLEKEGFDLLSLSGERLLVLQSLLEWKTIERAASECGISPPSVYKYLKELKQTVERRGRRYRISVDARSLREFVSMVGGLKENTLPAQMMWSSPEGRLLKTRSRIDGTLTAFSRFREFDVPVSSMYSYYFVPKRELAPEEIFVHSLRCAGEDTHPKVREFYLKNNKRLDTFAIDELAVHFDVADSWLDLQSQVADALEREGSLQRMDLTYLSPENVFFSNSVSKECGSILRCENILRREKLCWDMLFHEYVIQQKDPDFRWQALLSRFTMLEERTGVPIPIAKKLSKVYLEAAIGRALRKPKTVEELRGELGVVEYHLRNTLAGLVKRGLVAKAGERPVRFEVSRGDS